MNKNKIAVMADSGTDVPPNYREKYGIYWLPLLINYSDRTYLDGIDIQPHEMYDRLPVEIPKTSLPDRGMVTDLFDRIKADGYEKLLVVTISSGLSGTYNIIRAAQMVNDEEMDWHELLIRIKHEVPKSKVFFCLDTLKYLQKGGRIGLVSAMLGMSLSLKPIISCNAEGIYYTAAKAIGRARSIQKVLDLAKEFASQSSRSELAVMNGYAEEEGIATRRRAEAFIVNGEVTVTGQIGAALGVHTGPGLIGIGVLQR